ncbi:MAG: hypothetical protein Q8P31_09790 [Bacillota bacterium]|nr:hypothetical protein [Bacillota bacterium]
MRLINLRRFRGPLLLLAVLLVFWGFGLVRVTAAVSYAESEVLSGPWGAGSLEFGRGPDVVGRLQGPCGFDVDARGSVVVADTANRRVLRFDAKGEPYAGWQAGAAAGVPATAVVFDGKGQVHVADTARALVMCLDARGAETARVDLAADDAVTGGWILCDLAGHPEAGFYALLAAWPPGEGLVRVVRYDPGARRITEVVRYVLAADAAGPLQADDGLAVLPADLCTGSRGSLALSFRGGPFVVRLEVISAQGAALWAREISRESMIRRAVLLGGDSRGRFYVALDYGQAAEVLAVAASGDPVLVATVPPFRAPPAPGDAVPYTLSPGKVDEQGRLYLVVNTEARFRLLRLVPRALPGLKWWFR